MFKKKLVVLMCFALASAAMQAESAAAPYRLLLSGPAESVDSASNTVTVLGRRIVLRNTANILPGHKLNVFGAIDARGSVKPSIVQDTTKYAASGDQVLIAGAVTKIDQVRGRLFIGGAEVDYTPALANPRFVPPAIGDILEVVGMQPAGRGLILAGNITRSKGVNAGGQAAGVNAGGQSVGVNAGGQAVGVNAGGQSVGVNAGGQAAGVNAGGQAVGVNAGGQAV